MTEHRTYVQHLPKAQFGPNTVADMWVGRCHDCAWEGGLELEYPSASKEGREHERIRREKQSVHPWLDVK